MSFQAVPRPFQACFFLLWTPELKSMYVIAVNNNPYILYLIYFQPLT